MTEPSPDASPPAATHGDAAAKRGAQVAWLAVVVFSSWFVVSSTWQLTRGVFFDASATSAIAEPLAGQGPCARELRRLSAAVDRGLSAAALAPTEEAAVERFQTGLGPDWQDGAVARVASTCSAEPEGANALAVVERLRVAALAFARHRATDLAKVRGEVATELGR
jgi:hypothetical protein